MTQDFVHLRMHTEFSIKDGMLNPKKVVHKAIASGMKALAITDATAMFGDVIFYKAASAAGIKPILGADCSITNHYNRDDYLRLLFLARNHQGYLTLCDLLSRAWLTNQYKDRGEVDLDWITPEMADGLIVLSGFNTGAIGKAILNGSSSAAEQEARRLSQKFPHFFMELQRVGRPNDEMLVAESVKLAKKLGLPVVATQPIQFENSENFEFHEARVAIADGFTLANKARPRIYTPQQYFRTKEEMCELFKDIPSAIENSVEIAKRCNVTIKLGKPQLPIFPTPDGMSLKDYMAQLAREGLDRRLKVLYPDEKKREAEFPRYKERLEREIKIIQDMDFPGYFLIVQDFINWAKTHGCPVGPGRGSGAGSLVAYSLGITDLDPLAYDLLFERFLNPERVSMPDFDVDFCQNNRGRVIEYVKSKYGEESVSQIATFGTMGAKGVIKDVGRVLDMSYSEADRLSRMIPTRPGHNTTLEEALSEEPQFRAEVRNNPQARKLIEYALKLEGTTRSLGIHAGGVLIAPGKLIDFCPLYAAGMLPENVISMYDKKDVEAVGLVKFDFLGLTTLTIIERALDYIEKNTGVRPDIEHMECDDEDTYKKIFQTGDTVAVFQFESPGMHKLLIDAKPTQLSDLIALNALYRPGPMDLIPDFLDIRAGRKKAEYADPRLIPILEDTAGIMVYQEQVMLVAQKIGGYSLGGADILRRAMGKKDVAEMERQSKVFIEGAAKNGVSEEVATHLFELMRKFAGYGFNKSHAAAYSYVAYKTGWLKNYYPAEFLASSLSEVMTDPEKSLKILMDAKRHGVKLLGPDINESEFNYTSPKTMEIRMGLGALKGVGSAPAEAIKAERDKNGPFKDPFDLVKRVGSQLITKKIIQVFAMAGVFDSIEPNRRKWFENADVVVQSAQENEKAADQFSLFGEEPSNEVPIKEVAPWSERTRMEKEQYVLGFYFSGHPLEAYHSELKRNFGAVVAGTESENPGEYLVAGMYIGCEQRRGKDGSPFVTLHLATPDGPVDYSVKNQYFEQERARIKEIPKGEIVVVELKKSHSKKSGKTWASPGAFYPLYELRHRQKAHIVIRPAEEADPKELERLILDVQMTHPEEAIRVDFEFSDDRSFRVRLPCPYKAAADWTLVRDLEDSPSIQQVEVAYGL